MSDDNPKCTVLISTYNRPQYLQEAVASVVAQTFEDWELLVMNDGGEDVADVIAGFNDPRIRYFPDDENRGAAYRFNFGLRESRGDYVTYLGDDDLFYPNHLEVLSRALDDNPEAGLAYSDLYAVSCLVEPDTGRRHVLDKRIMVSRDFNRNFMFHYNHVLHVSLMHRREAAFRVGCFDENIKVLIEWSLNRRLCFIYDFVHVPVPTGEYYMPVFKSDRISVVQRKDKYSYQHNLRKIRTSLPPEPWPKVDKVTIIYPVQEWTAAVKEKILQVVDGFDHPYRFLILNNGTGKNLEAVWDFLGDIRDFGHITVKNTPERLTPLEAYRFGVKKSSAEFVFLITDKLQLVKSSKRLFGGLEYLKTHGCDAVKWDIPEEREGVFDLLIRRDLFLKASNPKKTDHFIDIQHITQVIPAGFKFDAIFAEMQKLLAKSEYVEAMAMLDTMRSLPEGAPGLQFLIQKRVPVMIELGRLEEAEKEVLSLIDRGYNPDNYIRLGQVLQADNRPGEAIEAYRKGIDCLGLTSETLTSSAFPISFPKELLSFHALMGLGECCLETGRYNDAGRYFKDAANLRLNSHKPYLGFARLFMAGNQLDRAEAALSKTALKDGHKDPATHRIIGQLCERHKRLDLAFECYLKAFKYKPDDEKSVDPLYYAGMTLGRWDEMIRTFETFLEKKPGHAGVLGRLASAYYQSGDREMALRTTDKGLDADPSHPVLNSLARKLRPQAEPALSIAAAAG